jgi:hypothetical protein
MVSVLLEVGWAEFEGLREGGIDTGFGLGRVCRVTLLRQGICYFRGLLGNSGWVYWDFGKNLPLSIFRLGDEDMTPGSRVEPREPLTMPSPLYM